jgi:polysaccharide deacetylase family protein (PEP-CTERM system associated)
MPTRVVDNTARLLDLFDEVQVSATFFVLGWVADRHPDVVRDIARRGHEVASHGFEHRLIYQQTAAAFRDDVRRARSLLQDITGQPVDGYRAPSFSVTEESLWALDVLIDAGYRYDASIFPIRHDRYGIPSSPRYPYVIRRSTGTITEVPASTVRVGAINLPVAGGGYFRLLPYGWTRWGVARLNREARGAVFYIHPWELDPEQPRLSAGRLTRIRHYHNLHKSEARLRSLLREFHFGTIASFLESHRPMNAPTHVTWAHAATSLEAAS